MLVPYDRRWPEQFEAAAAELKRLGNADWLVEHIGSTSIPGLRAKPIIDLAVRIRDRGDFDAHRDRLEASGWHIGSGVRSHLVMLFEREGQRTHIAHFFPAVEWEENNQRILRDWLLSHPADAAYYESAKIAAAAAARGQSASYNSAKTAVIQGIVDRARAERGLPSAAVYDK
ncbi:MULTISPECIES: GrpB family protein [unclassified Curtobacterium]|uniref:GrpB family protein n=1 Tax=unclassified Curtobacterium TaxID=257496 RepID=UPI0015E87C60|nr:MULTISPECIES: GrpB family protein [unclassified Curtobacterium]WIB63574.1 GrpB family protein [Curtobacterium sp. MCBD17_040]